MKKLIIFGLLFLNSVVQADCCLYSLPGETPYGAGSYIQSNVRGIRPSADESCSWAQRQKGYAHSQIIPPGTKSCPMSVTPTSTQAPDAQSQRGDDKTAPIVTSIAPVITSLLIKQKDSSTPPLNVSPPDTTPTAISTKSPQTGGGLKYIATATANTGNPEETSGYKIAVEALLKANPNITESTENSLINQTSKYPFAFSIRQYPRAGNICPQKCSLKGLKYNNRFWSKDNFGYCYCD